MRLQKNLRRGLVLLLSVAFMYGAIFAAWSWHARSRELKLSASKAEHLHYDIVELSLVSGDPSLDESFAAAPPRFVVMRGTETLTTIAGIREMTARRAAPGLWTARWPVPWNAPPGEYRPVLLGRPDLGERLHAIPFKIARRAPKPMPKGFVVATLVALSSSTSR